MRPTCRNVLTQTLNVFRNHDLISSSVDFGESLNPYSIICQGHPNTKDVLLADQMSTVEGGLPSAPFQTKDARFPHTYLQVGQALGFACRGASIPD
jgi:hypothetical protein